MKKPFFQFVSTRNEPLNSVLKLDAAHCTDPTLFPTGGFQTCCDQARAVGREEETGSDQHPAAPQLSSGDAVLDILRGAASTSGCLSG